MYVFKLKIGVPVSSLQAIELKAAKALKSAHFILFVNVF